MKKSSRRSSARDLAREEAVLSKPVNPTGAGEDPAVRALLDPSFAALNNQEAVQIALALQELVRGQASILGRLDQNSEEIARLNARMAKFDEAERCWETDRQRMLEDISSRADKLRLTGEAKDRMLAKVGNEFQEQVALARANIASNRIQFEQALATMPKVKVKHSGIPVMTTINGATAQGLDPIVVRIKHRVWVIPPDQEIEVPLIVAKRLEEMALSEAETNERKAALAVSSSGRSRQDISAFQAWQQIDQKYKTGTDVIPIASDQ